jgi:hypothetical protein
MKSYLLRGLMAAWLAMQGVIAATPTSGPGYESWELPVPSAGHTGFTLLTPAQTGVDFTNTLALSRSLTNHVLLNGSGVAAGDVDGDGLVDLYFCGLDGPNKLYRNLGNWKFEDITASAGVACADLDATGAVLADLDGDGDLDLIVNSIGGGTRVFLNDGKGHFTPSPRSPVLNPHRAGTSLALADMDGDGALDLYVTNYRPMFFFLDKPQTRYSIRMVNGEPQVAMIDGHALTDPEFTNRFVFQVHMANGKVVFSKEELGEVDVLYRNDGHGGFTEVPFTGGAFLDEEGKPLKEPPRDWGLSVMFRDLNGDGLPDIYVCNDFRTPDRIWLNDGHGHFRALPTLAIRQTCLSAMCMDVADINRDGFFDIFVADMLSADHVKRLTQRIDIRPEALRVGEIDNRPQYSRNMLQLSRGDGTFAEMAQFAGLEASDWTWSPLFLDVDLDGYEDLLVANGFERDTMNIDVQNQIEMLTRQQRLGPAEKMNLRKLYHRLNTPNLAFRNLGNCRFQDVSSAWGFDTPAVSQGACLADLDNDGDLDVIVNNFNGPAGLYRNESSAPRIAVRLKGQSPNTRGIGAKIEVLGGPVPQSQEMICGGRYCSSDDPMRTFAAGTMTNDLQIVVTWRSGKRSVVEHARANRLYRIDEAFADSFPKSVASRNGSRETEPLFEDVSAQLGHVHHDDAFDDFDRQPLLPRKLSQLGPGLSWFDVDGDGWDDLIIGTGQGGSLAIYRNVSGIRFERMPQALAAEPASRDETTVLGWAKGQAGTELLVGCSNYEDGQASGPAVRQLDFSRSLGDSTAHAGNPASASRTADIIAATRSATGPMALADVQGNGTLELFVGGRVVPGRYPEPASSRLFRVQQGTFELDEPNTAVLEKVGLVSGAVFSDLDGDGWPDLLLACEWGPIHVFHNDHGKLTEATRQLGLDRYVGWWNGVNVGDFDGDGKMDIVASNWGQNSKYEPFRAQPLRLYYGDFNGDGGVQMLEAYFDPAMKQIVPWRRLDETARSMPFLNARFSTFEQFGQANVEQILGDRLSQATLLQANWLESTLFLNRGDHFEPVVLPFEAQLSPGFAVEVGDLNGDGKDDLFLGQNFFDVPTETSRYDAGRGLCLLGDGHGHFRAMPGAESGLLIYGEQRGAALCDYDGDGRLDLAVSQNGNQTRLFRNRGGRPGLRVHLKGPSGNPQGIGAQLRLVFGAEHGPRHEVHAGAGYCSQDSATTVLAMPTTPSALEVRWPGGQETIHAIPQGTKVIDVDEPGPGRSMR